MNSVQWIIPAVIFAAIILAFFHFMVFFFQ